MYHTKFPRLYELKDQLSQSENSESLYFQNFEKTVDDSVSAHDAFRASGGGNWGHWIMKHGNS